MKTDELRAVASAIVLPWRVDLVVRGHTGGSYYFRSKGAATRDANRRSKKFGVLGCSYRVRQNDESSDLRTVGVPKSEQREPQVRCDDWLGERKRRSRPEVEREAGAEQNSQQHEK